MLVFHEYSTSSMLQLGKMVQTSQAHLKSFSPTNLSLTSFCTPISRFSSGGNCPFKALHQTFYFLSMGASLLTCSSTNEHFSTDAFYSWVHFLLGILQFGNTSSWACYVLSALLLGCVISLCFKCVLFYLHLFWCIVSHEHYFWGRASPDCQCFLGAIPKSIVCTQISPRATSRFAPFSCWRWNL